MKTFLKIYLLGIVAMFIFLEWLNANDCAPVEATNHVEFFCMAITWPFHLCWMTIMVIAMGLYG